MNLYTATLYFSTSTGFGWNKPTILHAISYIGIGAIIGLLVWIGRKIFDLGKIMQRLDSVEKDVKEVKRDVRKNGKDIAKRIDDLMTTIVQNGLTESHSPRQLTPEGTRILESSGIGAIIDDKFDLLVDKVAAKHPQNAYRAEKAVIDAVKELGEDPTIKDGVEEGAFNSGSIASIVLFVGAIYIRDRILSKLQLNPAEIDEHPGSDTKPKR